MRARGMADQHKPFGFKGIFNKTQSPSDLAGHLRQRDRGQQAEADRRIARAGAQERLGGERLVAPALAFPGAAMDENQEFFTPRAVEVELLDLRAAVAVRFRLADPLPHRITRRAIAPDDLVGVGNEGALLVLSIE